MPIMKPGIFMDDDGGSAVDDGGSADDALGSFTSFWGLAQREGAGEGVSAAAWKVNKKSLQFELGTVCRLSLILNENV